jgi:ABC-type phosphate/phosphonate transport system substrate-binding protein
MNVLRALFAPMGRNERFFESVCTTGSHEASLMMIAHRWADVAAIDCITYALLQRHRPRALREIRVLCCTSRFPAPPFVVGAQVSEGEVDQIRQALVETLAAPDMRHVKDALLINEVVDLPLQSYQSIADLERRALESEYSEVCSGLQMAAGGTGFLSLTQNQKTDTGVFRPRRPVDGFSCCSWQP